jgi:hypothetical protein
MARSYIVFGDVEGKLAMLLVECTQCQRKGRYSVLKLIHGYRKGARARPFAHGSRTSHLHVEE